LQKLILGITGSIAAYKTPDLVRRLREKNIDVRVVLSAAAKEFVTPLALQAVSGKIVHEHLLDPASESAMSHIELARWADLILIAPCSAHFIAKLAYGFADDLLSTLCLATQAEIIIAPAMNQAMWSNSITQANLAKLSERGFILLKTGEGEQACGDIGFGRMLEPTEIAEEIAYLSKSSKLKSKRFLITAGPTQEAIDPVRYLSNKSSGKMGYALAEAALQKGAEVTLISGPVNLTPPTGVKLIAVTSAAEMLEAVQKEINKQDVFISTAAVADYRPAQIAKQKIKKGGSPLTLELEATIDILASITQLKTKPFTVGFAAETENILENAQKKFSAKNLDLMIVNDVSDSSIGFNSNENAVSVISKKPAIHLSKASKKIIAQQLINLIEEQL
jgi:phosphopantothenoylcysteine decarboxylase/phosphopantothenate--cysteine ligase